MWLYFNQNGALVDSIEHGPAARAGTTNFQIFAYFEGVDTVINNFATIKLVKPDLNDSSYPLMAMTLTSLKFVPDEGEHSAYFSPTGGPNNDGVYKGFLFDFSEFTGDQNVTVLLDTPGLWEAIISLYRSRNVISVQGTSTFNVQGGIVNTDGEEVSIDQLLQFFSSEIANKLDIQNGIAVVDNVRTIDISEYEDNQIFLDKATKQFYIKDEDDDILPYRIALPFTFASSTIENLYIKNGNLYFSYSDVPNGGIAFVKLTKTDSIYGLNAYILSQNGEIKQYVLSGLNGDAELYDTLSSATPTIIFATQTYVINKISSLDPKYKQVSITWAELKAIRDAGELVPDTSYRITDYEFTTTTANTSSAGHQFDIIVIADDESHLNEKARACLHEGDTYFANNKLEAWELWYRLDNDTNRFDWVDSTNGKGVIYRMIDEFGNDVAYDFKNCLFTKTSVYTNAYTFAATRDSDSSLIDGSLKRFCHRNIIKPYIDSNDVCLLNFNVFVSTESSINSSYGNIIHEDCHDNYFKNVCTNNTLQKECYNNSFNGSNFNILGIHCWNVSLKLDCDHNTFGCYCATVSLGQSCSENVFENSAQGITFGYSCSSNHIGQNCYQIKFGHDCSFNIFETDCDYVYFGNSSTQINYCRYIIVESGCKYLDLTSEDTSASSSNYLQNTRVHFGIKGYSSTNRRTISVPDRNLNYSTDIYAANSQEIIL